MMKTSVISLFLILFLSLSLGKIIFEDDFSDQDWKSRWVVSSNKVAEGTAGEWALSPGKFYADKKNVGLKTTQDARFYTISSKMAEFSNKDSDLVLSFSVKHEQEIDCGGGYIKLFRAGLDQENFNADSEYNIMFGPDICGNSHKIVHFVLNKYSDNHLIQKNVKAETDVYTHTYTLHLKKDNSYGIYVDGEIKQEGTIEADFNILEPSMIKDPAVSKPEDWDERKFIDDDKDVQPEDYDDTPPMITDVNAVKPGEWDDDKDGEWEAPQIPNHDYKGPWKPKRIENPNYNGVWKHPEITNPEYKADPELYLFESTAYIGIEVWQVKAGSIFSNFLVTDDLNLALKQAKARVTISETEKKLNEVTNADKDDIDVDIDGIDNKDDL